MHNYNKYNDIKKVDIEWIKLQILNQTKWLY